MQRNSSTYCDEPEDSAAYRVSLCTSSIPAALVEDWTGESQSHDMRIQGAVLACDVSPTGYQMADLETPWISFAPAVHLLVWHQGCVVINSGLSFRLPSNVMLSSQC